VIISTDNFFINKGVLAFKPVSKYYDINSAMSYWDYLKLPHIHKVGKDDCPLNVKKILLLLYTFSSWLIPLKRQIYSNGQDYGAHLYSKVPVPSEFEEQFSREFLNVFNYNEVCLKVKQFFNWDLSEVKSIIDYLSTDLLNKKANVRVDCYSRPFLKFGDNIYWMTNLYEDLKWECNLHQRMIKEGLNHNTQIANIEKSLADDFEQADFGAVPSHKYYPDRGSDNEQAEIDTLAYKDGYLFIIEMKTTYVEENPAQKAIYHSKKVEGRAKYQLAMACEYIKRNFHKIKSIKDLKIDRDLSEIEIVPLIVSNIFDYDGEVTENGILKISDFTLRLILNNDWAELMFSNSKMAAQYLPPNTNHFDLPVISLDAMGNKNNPDFNPTAFRFPDNRDQCSLWSSDKECSPQDLLSAIKQNKVWAFVDKIWDFKPSTIDITKP